MGVLIIVGIIVKSAVWCGYGVTGAYFVGTGVQYVKDYKESIEKERV